MQEDIFDSAGAPDGRSAGDEGSCNSSDHSYNIYHKCNQWAQQEQDVTSADQLHPRLMNSEELWLWVLIGQIYSTNVGKFLAAPKSLYHIYFLRKIQLFERDGWSLIAIFWQQ